MNILQCHPHLVVGKFGYGSGQFLVLDMLWLHTFILPLPAIPGNEQFLRKCEIFCKCGKDLRKRAK